MKRIMFTLLALVLAISVIAPVAAQAPASKDLMTELHNFWPSQADFDKNVWNLSPVQIASVDVYDNGRCFVNGQFGASTERFYAQEGAFFESDIYRLYNNGYSVPTVKGEVYWVTRGTADAGNVKELYILVIHDNMFIKKNTTNFVSTDNFGEKFHRVTFVQEKKTLDNGQTVVYVSNDGEPMDKYEATAADGTKYVIDPSIYPMVELFKVTHPTGDFMQGHPGQKIASVKISPFGHDDVVTNTLNSVMKDTIVYYFIVTFYFSDGTREDYQVFRKDGSYIIVNTSYPPA